MAETVAVLYDDVYILLFRRMCARYSCGTFAEGCFFLQKQGGERVVKSYFYYICII